MPQLGFLAAEESAVARWLIGAMPCGEQYGRLHFGPMADRLVTQRPAYGTAVQLVQRSDILLQPGLELRVVDPYTGRISAWASDGLGSMDPLAAIGLLQLAGPLVGAAGLSGQPQFAPLGQANPSQVRLPAGFMNNGRRKLRIYLVAGDNGTTDTLTLQGFLGANGNANDDQIFTSGAIPASQRSADMFIEVQRLTATTVQVWIRTGTASTTVLPTPLALTSSLDTVDQYLTVSMKMGGNTNIPTLADLRIELH